MTGLDALDTDVKCAEKAKKTWAHDRVLATKLATVVDVLISDLVVMIII